MKTKIVKLRDAHGIARYEEVIDAAGVIAVARALVSADRPNSRAAALVAWADSLGRAPTGHEFAAWFEAHGGTITDASGDVENYAN